MLAYFDTNVFDNLIKKTNGVTDADQRQLGAAVSSGQLTIVVSHINIRETLAASLSPRDREHSAPADREHGRLGSLRSI